MYSGLRDVRFAVISVLLLAATTMQAHAATITVTNTDDSGPGSLRQALAVAHGGDRITFAVSGAIMLTSGGLEVTKSVTISGPGANQLSIDASNTFGGVCVFHVVSGEAVTISGLTITSSNTGICNDEAILTVSNCVVTGSSYAGLFNNASLNSSAIVSLTITNSVFSNNIIGITNQSEPANGLGIIDQSEPPFGPTGTMARSTLIRKPADHESGAGNCTACMTIANSVVTGNATGIFNVAYAPRAATVTVLNSSLTDNFGGIGTYGFEGNAEVTVTNSTISGNSSGIDSGISNVSIANSTISGNSFGLNGGGINVPSRNVSIVNSTISGNSANGLSGSGIYGGGGMNVRGRNVSIVNSTISGNSANGLSGGGILADGLDDLSIVNSTISGNSAGTGGGIYNFNSGIYNSNSSLHVANTTIAGNSAGSGGGIYDGLQGQLQISNTIIDAGASGENIFNSGGTVTSHGYNLSSDDGGGYLNGPGDQINTDPMLVPCKTMADLPLRMPCCRVALRSTLAIPTSLHRLPTTSAAVLLTGCSTVALISVHLRRNRHRVRVRLRDRARLRGRGQLRAKQTSNQLSSCFRIADTRSNTESWILLDSAQRMF